MNDYSEANNLLTLITAFRKLCEADQLRLYQAMHCQNFHQRCAIIDGMTGEGKQIVRLAFERITQFKQPEALPQPLVYTN
jgi:hypothetical protein